MCKLCFVHLSCRMFWFLQRVLYKARQKLSIGVSLSQWQKQRWLAKKFITICFVRWKLNLSRVIELQVIAFKYSQQFCCSYYICVLPDCKKYKNYRELSQVHLKFLSHKSGQKQFSQVLFAKKTYSKSERDFYKEDQCRWKFKLHKRSVVSESVQWI